MIKEVELDDDQIEDVLTNLPEVFSVSSDLPHVFIPENDYGFAEIYKIYGEYFVFLIPQYGGIPQFYKSYGWWRVKDLITDLKSIT